MKKKSFIATAFSLLVAVSAFAQTRSFEGDIFYTNTVTVDKTLQRIYPWAQSGEYEMQFVRKGQDESCEESYTGVSTLMLRSKNEIYVYSRLLKKGYKGTYDAYLQHLEKLASNMQGDFKPTGETKEIHGYTCQRYVGERSAVVELFGAKMNTEQKVDSWVCPDFGDEWVGSEHLAGLPFLYEDISRMSLPLLGEGAQHQTLVVSGIKARTVEEAELAVPTDVQFESSNNVYDAMRKLQKEIRKYMKKNKITDNLVRVRKENVSSQEGEWDF